MADPPLHLRIRAEIEGRILSGEWPPGHRVPFEHELMQRFRCSRMTVSKALSALAARGLITRRRRAGSVVAAPPGERAMLEIGDFAAEAGRDGRDYRHEMLARRIGKANRPEAASLELEPGTRLLRLITLHRMDGVPSALESRVINLAAVPEAEGESFAAEPPGTWLLRRVPWTEAAHVVQACAADAASARHLDVPRGLACLVLERRTWQSGRLVTEARITYPGDRHRLVGRFWPAGGHR